MRSWQIPEAHQELARDLSAREAEGVLEQLDPFRLRSRMVRVQPRSERAEVIAKLEDRASVRDRGVHLESIPDDAGVLQQPLAVSVTVGGDSLDRKIIVRGTKALTLFQNGQPAQASLIDLEEQPFEEAVVVVHRKAVFQIVVWPVDVMPPRGMAVRLVWNLVHGRPGIVEDTSPYKGRVESIDWTRSRYPRSAARILKRPRPPVRRVAYAAHDPHGSDMTGLGIGLLLALTVSSGGEGVRSETDPDRLYGRVVTSDGRVFEGYLRWDRNEAHWTDVVDGLKEIPLEWEQEAERLDPEYAAAKRRERSLVAFGVRLTWDVDDDEDALMSESGIRFAHVRRLSPVDSRTARITLTSGEEIMLHSSSTDLGRAMRGVEVEVPGGTTIEVEWQELERVDFLSAPARMPAPVARRLFARVETWSDVTLTGYLAWDLDEIFDTDILDGRGGGIDHEIEFRDIRRIEWISDRSARVLLRNGQELELRGTNDVDRSNRGIEVADPGFGRVIVRWEDFKSADFDVSVEPGMRPGFNPGDPVRGLVMAVDGRAIEGEIRWGNDETQAWEFLDGWFGDLAFDIEFGAIAEIRKSGENRVVVTLRDGRRLELEDTEDVDARHRGIFVKPEGRARRLVRWRDFDRMVLDR